MKKTTYEIDDELKTIARLKVPENINAFSLMNELIGLSRCKSDRSVCVNSYQTPGYDGAELTTFVIEPRYSKERLPCIVFFHGGGFMLKASQAHYRIAKMYAEKTPCKVVYTDYRLAPEYPFPIPAEDCFRTYAWTLDHAAMLNIQGDKIIAAGDSAGGNLALAAALMARDREVRMPAGELLIYPVTDRRMITESMKKYVDTPVWNANLSHMMWKAYLGDRQPEKMEYASPAETESFEAFPPTYIEVAQYDALHDEGVSLYHQLQRQDVACELHEIEGACHGFEIALRSRMLAQCMNRRIGWLRSIMYPQNT